MRGCRGCCFISSHAIGARRGWLGEKEKAAAQRALEGLETRLTPDGFLQGVAPSNKPQGGEPFRHATKGYIMQFGMGMNMTTEPPIQAQALDHIRELLTLHWNEAKDAADEDGRFSIGLRISVSDGAPAKLKVKCSISRTITDEVESTVEDAGQMKLL